MSRQTLMALILAGVLGGATPAYAVVGAVGSSLGDALDDAGISNDDDRGDRDDPYEGSLDEWNSDRSSPLPGLSHDGKHESQAGAKGEIDNDSNIGDDPNDLTDN